MKLNNKSLKWKLFFYIFALTFFIILIFGVFQIALLDRVYRTIRLKGVSKLCEQIVELTDGKDIATDFSQNGYIYTKLVELGSENESSIYFYKREELTTVPSGTTLIYQGTVISTSGGINTLLISNTYTSEIWQKAVEAGYRNSQFFVVFSENTDKRFNVKVVNENKITLNESIVGGNFIRGSNNETYLLIVDARLTPVQPAVDTLKTQLFYITIIVILLTLLAAIIISRYISSPIMKMNETAKALAKRHYDIKFDGNGYLEIAELNATLNYAVSELKKSEILQRELLANISHDLRTPLTLISGYAEMIRDLPSDNNTESVQIIIDEAGRLNGLVNDLLNLSQISARTEPLKIITYSITDSIKSIVERQQRFLDNKSFEINFIYSEDIFVEADTAKIEQVIYNFITNAINYSGDSKNIDVVQEKIDNKVKISIRDYGIGIKEEDMSLIWQRYYRVDKGHQRSTQGSGLGLSIIKEILDYHEFPFGVDSKENIGSTFWFIMPIKK